MGVILKNLIAPEMAALNHVPKHSTLETALELL